MDLGFKPGWDDWSVRAGFNRYYQDLLNAAIMAFEGPVALVGHEGMSFGSSVGYMVHPVGKIKPWNKGYIKRLLLKGSPMPLANRQYWKFARYPIKVVSKWDRAVSGLDIVVTSAFSRLIGK